MESKAISHSQTIFVPLQALKSSKDGNKIELIEFLSSQMSVEKECIQYFEEQYKVRSLFSFYANKETPKKELAEPPFWNIMISLES
jgi:hypothetical protein